MAQTTTNYGLYKPEATDTYNHLVYDNPNMDTIDAAMKDNADHAIDNASCIKSGTVHSVTRTNSSCNFFKFTATGDWNTGDTMNVDGTPVSVFLPNGKAPLDNAYVINSEVIAAIQGSRVTLYCPAEQAANEVPYDNTGSGLTATDVNDAIDELKTLLNTTYATIGIMNTVSALSGSVIDAFTNVTYFPNNSGILYARSSSAADAPSWAPNALYLFFKFGNNGLVFAFYGQAFGYAFNNNGVLTPWQRIQ